MAQRVAIDLVDDLDDSEATVTVTFSLEGSTYEIDLNDQHADELRDALEPYITHGRLVGGRTRGKRVPLVRPRAVRAAPQPQRSNEPAVIRQWALENGVAVSERGRISAAVLEQYHEATG